jgi:hypothetical protein
MRSGSQDTNDSYIGKMLEDQLTLITLVTEDALRLAEIYSKHSGRKAADGKPVIATEDFSRAFKVRAYYGSEFWNLPDIQERIQKIKEYIQEEDEMGGGLDSLKTVDDSQMTAYHDSNCTFNKGNPCVVCEYMNGITRAWPSWVPQGPMDFILKKAIDTKFPKLRHRSYD